ncbi:MAG: hypothetical protein MK033_01100 [Candidatus Caenarcaniphilales bacterium]|nr:hypothetical protein [Candidatus Caenarcaniphilales bacterium]
MRSKNYERYSRQFWTNKKIASGEVGETITTNAYKATPGIIRNIGLKAEKKVLRELATPPDEVAIQFSLEKRRERINSGESGKLSDDNKIEIAAKVDDLKPIDEKINILINKIIEQGKSTEKQQNEIKDLILSNPNELDKFVKGQSRDGQTMEYVIPNGKNKKIHY